MSACISLPTAMLRRLELADTVPAPSEGDLVVDEDVWSCSECDDEDERPSDGDDPLCLSCRTIADRFDRDVDEAREDLRGAR